MRLDSNFSARVASTAVLLPGVLWCVWQGHAWMQGLIVLLGVGLAAEWSILCYRNVPSTRWGKGLAGLILFAGIAALLMAFTFFLGQASYPGKPAPAVWLYLFCVVWGTDVGAYATGQLCGGPRLVPRISPNKTWSGFIGGTAWGTAAGTLLALNAELFFSRDWGRTTFATFFLTLIAQGGDLLESAAKRFLGVKDSSRLIPGHGGLWDRLDSLVAVGVFLFIFERLSLGI